jgi:hypothetical protein
MNKIGGLRNIIERIGGDREALREAGIADLENIVLPHVP